jgi:lysophospholipase L1-like esterase
VRWRVGALLVGAPALFAALLAVQAFITTRGEYLRDVDYEVGGVAEVPGSAEPPLRLAVLGDSTAAGVGSPTAEGALPLLVATRVAESLGRDVEVRGLGVSGARTADVHDRQIPQLLNGSVDVVVIVIGSNDVTHLTPPWRFRRSTEEMLRLARDQTGAPVILGGIPLFGGATALPRPLRDVVDAYARPLRDRQAGAAARVPGATFVDISRLASPRFVGVPDAMSWDGFHPAEVGYGFWADALAPGVVTAVGP